MRVIGRSSWQVFRMSNSTRGRGPHAYRVVKMSDGSGARDPQTLPTLIYRKVYAEGTPYPRWM